jgi:RNA polymerase sigma-70 factor (ECF subfamily)
VDTRTEAIEALYRERFAGYCEALAAVTGSREIARDAVQEAFARALRKRRRLRRDESLAPWVWTIALRVAFDTRRQPGIQDPTALHDPASQDRLTRDPELAAAIRSLPARRRTMVFLRYFADFTYAEIAEACQVSEGTVAATLAQAHEALRARLSSQHVQGARR